MNNKLQPNQQNMHMLDCHIQTSQALQTLIYKGITVLEVRFGSIRPVIVVQASAETQKLKSVLVRSVRRHGEQRMLRSTLINQCRVEWESDHVH